MTRPTSSAAPLWILALLGMTLFLREARTLCVPVALSVLAAYALEPLLVQLDRTRVPRSASAAAVVALIFALVGWAGWAVSDDVGQMVRELPQQVRQIREDLREATSGGVLDGLSQASAEMQPDQASSQSNSPLASDAMADYLWQGSTNLFGLFGHIVVIAFLTYFLLVGAAAWHRRLLRVSGDVMPSRRTGAEMLGQVAEQIQRFLLMRVVTALIVGAATGVALWFFGAPAPFVWAIAAGVLNWVPYFGPILVSGGLLIVGFVSGGMSMAIELSLTALVITSLEGWLLTPLLLGRAASMNTLAVFLSLLFWSWVWGVWGTILAVPMMTIVKSVADHLEPLGWLSELLGEDDAARA